MVGYIDDHRDRFGVEPICAVLPIAPSTYFLHKARAHDAATRSARARRDDELRAAIQRVWDANLQVYGPRKVNVPSSSRSTTTRKYPAVMLLPWGCVSTASKAASFRRQRH